MGKKKEKLGLTGIVAIMFLVILFIGLNAVTFWDRITGEYFERIKVEQLYPCGTVDEVYYVYEARPYKQGIEVRTYPTDVFRKLPGKFIIYPDSVVKYTREETGTMMRKLDRNFSEDPEYNGYF